MRIKNRSKYLSILIANPPRIDYDEFMNESMNLMIESIAICAREIMNDEYINDAISHANDYASKYEFDDELNDFESIRDEFIENHYFDAIFPEMRDHDDIFDEMIDIFDLNDDEIDDFSIAFIEMIDSDEYLDAIDSIFASRIARKIDQK